MKKNKIKIIYITLTISLLFGNCDKKQLDISPVIPIKTTDNAYSTQDDAISATNAVYAPLNSIYNWTQWQIGDVMSDDADHGGGGATDGIEVEQFDQFTLTSFNPVVERLWKQCYIGIVRANIVLEKVPKIKTISTTIKNRCMGEATFLRAFYYFHLVRNFGDVPLYTNFISVDEALKIKRSPKQDVLNQIIADLKIADTLLPKTHTGNDLGRVTSGTVKTTLANIYLFVGDKTNAAAKALEVINSDVYKLYADYGENFKLNNENGVESIFEVQCRSGASIWGETQDNGQGQVLNTFFAPRNQNLVLNQGYGFNVPTKNLVDNYEKTGALYSTIKDKRRPATLWIPGDVLGSYTQPASLEGSPNGFNTKKYFVSIANSTSDDDQWRCPLNIPIYRYAEVLLIYAEAAGPNIGLPYLNQVRARAGLSPIQAGLSEQNYLDAVFNERRVEFALEMHRWYDLLRYPTDAQYFIKVMQSVGRTNVAAKHRYLPIPQTEIDKNPNLTQNTGY